MTIGFHYHIPIKRRANGSLETQSFYGLFIDSIAKQFTSIILFSYTPLEEESIVLNYVINARNIVFVDMGKHSNVVSRIMRFTRQYHLLKSKSKAMDVMLVRAPTPLVLLLYFLKDHFRIVPFLVGNYVEGAKNVQFGFVKKSLIKLLAYSIEYCQRMIIKGGYFMANSQPLLEQYEKKSTGAFLVKTTTISQDDFYVRDFIFSGPTLRLLFTGRIDESKGLLEIVEACKLLSGKIDVEFHFAGLVVKGKETLPHRVLELAKGTPLESRIFYHGLKRVGDELNTLYRSCDIFIVGSKSNFEGFPRTIWEAMANSLPVIASPMGSIPVFLRDGIDALLLNAVTPKEISDAVLVLYGNPELSKQLIENGLLLARENTLESQAEKICSVLKSIGE